MWTKSKGCLSKQAPSSAPWRAQSWWLYFKLNFKNQQDLYACLIAALVLILYLLVKELRKAVYAGGGGAVGACSHERVAERVYCVLFSSLSFISIQLLWLSWRYFLCAIVGRWGDLSPSSATHLVAEGSSPPWGLLASDCIKPASRSPVAFVALWWACALTCVQ